MAEEKPLRLIFRRTGGLFAGNQLETSATDDELGEADLRMVRASLAEADIEDLAARSPIAGGPDSYQYDLTVERPEGDARVVVAERELPPSLRPLIKLLEERAEAERRGR